MLSGLLEICSSNLGLRHLWLGIAMLLVTSTTPSRADQHDDRLDQLCNDYLQATIVKGDDRTADKIADEIIQLGKSTSEDHILARGYLRRAYFELASGNWDERWEEWLTKGVELAGEENTLARAEALMFRGHMRGKWLHEFDASLNDLHDAIWIGRQLPDDVLLATAYEMASEILLFKGREGRARDYAFRGLLVAERTENPAVLHNNLTRLVHVLALFHADEVVVGYARRLRDHSKAQGATSQIAQMILGADKSYDDVVRRIESLIEDTYASEAESSRARRASLRLNLANHIRARSPERGIELLDACIKDFEAISDPSGLKRARLLRAMIPEPGVDREVRLKEFNEALASIDDLESLANKLGFSDDIAEFYESEEAWEGRVGGAAR